MWMFVFSWASLQSEGLHVTNTTVEAQVTKIESKIEQVEEEIKGVEKEIKVYAC